MFFFQKNRPSLEKVSDISSARSLRFSFFYPVYNVVRFINSYTPATAVHFVNSFTLGSSHTPHRSSAASFQIS